MAVKNKLFLLAVLAFAAVAVFSGCRPFVKKVITARENELDQKAEESLELKDSIQLFRAQSAARISNYRKTIAEFRSKNATGKMENQAGNEKLLEKTEKEITSLQKRLNEYKGGGQNAWTAFRNDFNHDMDDIGKELQELPFSNTE